MPRNTIEALEREFAKADADHTALTDRLQESANKRELARKKLEEAREAPADETPEPEKVEVAGE